MGIVALAAALVSAQPVHPQEITGRVVDAQNAQAIAEAQVYLFEANLGGLSEGNGSYRIQNVPAGTYVVSVQRLGFRPTSRVVELAPEGVVELDFELEREALTLDEVVATGTPRGSQMRAIGTVVERVDVPSLLADAPVRTVEDALTGRIPGVMMIGSPNSAGDGAQIRIRGRASFSLPGDPIVYVDGVRINSWNGFTTQYSATSRLNDIDLRDIESIEVIKGPAAATLYGTEASNGVIQILTRRGVRGEPVFDFTTETGTMWLPHYMIPEGWVANPDSCPSLPCDGVDQLVQTNLVDINRERGFPDFFHHGLAQGYHLGVRGGTDLLGYSVSVSRNTQDGIVEWNWDKRTSVRASLQVAATETFNLALSTAYSEGRRSTPQQFWASNFAFGGRLSTIFDGSPDRGFRIPPEEMDRSIHSETVENQRTTWSLDLTHSPTDWLAHRLVAGLDQITERIDEVYVPQGPDYRFHGFGGRFGLKAIRALELPALTADFSGTLSYRLEDGRLGSATSYGLQYYHNETKITWSSGEGFPVPGLSSVGSAAVTQGFETFQENTTLGVYLQQQFDWGNRVFLTGALRSDDNTAFGGTRGAPFYPKVMATWVVHEEDFWDVGWIDQLRLRGAWGAAGQQPDAHAAARSYRPETGPDQQPVVTAWTFGNTELGPERGEELELGLDAEILDGRITASITHFSRSTKDAILSKSLPPSLWPGRSTHLVNIGEVKAWGTETSLSMKVWDRETLGWNLAVALTTLGNRITDMGEDSRIQVGRSRAHYEGFPLAVVSQRRIVSAEFLNGQKGRVDTILCDGGSGKRGLEFGGPAIPCEDAPDLVWGPSQPSWLVNLTSTWILFSSWRLTANLDGQGGHWAHADYIGARHAFSTSQLALLQDDAVGQAYRQIARHGLALHRAGFIKLRELSLSYTLPVSVIESVGATRASATLGARNVARLWLAQGSIERERVTDPEVSDPRDNFGSESRGDWPPLSSWSIRLDVTF